MDIRITNTCNSDCLYCLEQSLRTKKEFLDTQEVYDLLDAGKREWDNIINFYGGNPLLHPHILDIVSYCKESWFTSIGILSNSFSHDKSLLWKLIEAGLNNIGVYFHSFQEDVHNRIVNGGISLQDLLQNLELLRANNIFYKCIIHINGQNIDSTWKDIVALNKRYGCHNFEFVNYFPFDRPYEVYRNLLEYDVAKERKNIDSLFKAILKLSLDVKFVKFHRSFFWTYSDFYDFSQGILQQIGEEDRERLEVEDEPFCLTEERCGQCFIQDNCTWYGKRHTW